MDLGINGRKALVTGASAGLGAAAAMALAAEGVEVVINSRDVARLESTAAAIAKKTGLTPRIIPGDLSDAGDISRVVKEAGPVDILVSNSGGPPPGDFLDQTEEAWAQATDLVFSAARRLTRGVLPGMRERGWGRVIYITSVGVLEPINTLILSNACRAAVTGLCKTLSNNYAGEGITFNCVCPGYTATERLMNLARQQAETSGKTPEDVIAGFGSAIPVGRVGQPGELAATIAFLAGEQAAFITGASIPVDGGHHHSLL